MSTERRRHKRYRPKTEMKAVLLPYIMLSEEKHLLDHVDGFVVDYSDGGVKVCVVNHSNKDLGRLLWTNQELYILLHMSDESSFTLKGTLVRFEGHVRDDSFFVAVLFKEENTDPGLLQIEDIKDLRMKLHTREDEEIE